MVGLQWLIILDQWIVIGICLLILVMVWHIAHGGKKK